MELPAAFVEALSQQLGNEVIYPEDAAPSLHLQPPVEVDFVVVGAGASGATIACRLAQAYPRKKVLLVESGGDPPISSEIPALWHALWRADLVWTYPCEPKADSAFKGLRGQRPILIRGRCLGGTSSINGLPYLRGHPSDYDSWQIPGWTFEDVLPYFKKSENMQDTAVLVTNASFHGTDGELTVEAAAGLDPMKDIIKDAALAIGHQLVTDFNGPPQSCIGFGDVHRTQRNATRCSTAKAFLSAASGRKDNLLIARHTTAIQITFSPDGKRANGVILKHAGEEIIAKVRREVVLAAGAIASPQLLLLSGVGPYEHLRNMGVPLVKDLPVGDFFQDQAIFHGLILSVPALPEVVCDPFKQFLFERKGPLSSVGLMELMGFVNTDSTKDWPCPSVQFNHARYPKGRFQSKLLAPEIEESIKKINRDHDIVVMMAFLLHPKEVGTVRLRSKDPNDVPIIETGLLADPRDVTILLEAIRLVEKMATTESFTKAGVRLRYIDFPTAENLVPGSDAYWEYAVRTVTSSAFHPVGTCGIGRVVDSRLRLKGIDNIVVADAAAIPRAVSANPNVPAIMVSERAAQFIIDDGQS